ncbi:competence/damage-inducible protein A [Gordonia sp. HNM0687]|uniref:CinA-like protein n=1 Tax=Gordonia mangrovi TaxID=2665643 RepID=A0A6L7GQ45_9ACTN|nr:competence/damage-inducible protein A [Gordonia mangrovi]MXP21732.1 competence/damage-inducible protein A [Gordonia mangrovi]UVF80462.1 competence/damage-inducible protein A [Gordonia mangrovi]
MSVRAGIVVTGTEVLTGRVTDQNGPWVAGRLLDLGVDVAHITICGDRPADLIGQLRFLADDGVDLIVTTGGLGPTADDLTVAAVADFCRRPLHLDADLEAHIADIIDRWMKLRNADADTAPLRAGIRKQAMVPDGAAPIPPTGTAPGVAVPAAGPLPAIVVLPGPPRELRAMWPNALTAAPIAAAVAGRVQHRQEIIRAYGLSEADLAETLRTAEQTMSGFDDLEITTCLRHGELEMVTRFPDHAAATYTALAASVTDHHRKHIFSTDGSTIDDQLVAALAGRTVATAESCTGGMVAARLTDRAGSSAYLVGGVVAYANETKIGQLDVPAALIDEHGAVSEEVAAAMADGAVRRLGADIAVSTTGVAGPGGGSDAKPVGTVCFGVAVAGCPTITVRRFLPGDRANVRMLSTVAAMHLLVGVLTD